MSGRFDGVVTVGSELGRFAERQGSAVAGICAGRILGTALYLTGALVDAERHLRDALQTYRSTGAIPPRSTAYTHHPGLTTPATLSHVLWALGFPEQAVASGRDAIESCRTHPEANSMAYSLQWAILLHLLLRDHAGALAAAEEAIRLGEERGSNFWRRNGAWGKGAALVLEGKVAAGLSLLGPNLREFVEEGGLQMAPQGFCHEAEAYLALDELERCEFSLGQAQDIVDGTNQAFYVPELRRVVGLLHRRRGRLSDAEAAFKDGIGAARVQSARAWELRLACDLARLWRDQGRLAEARDLLAPVYAAFTEGFGFPDLVEARALLEELGAAPVHYGGRRQEKVRMPRGPDRLREPVPGR